VSVTDSVNHPSHYGGDTVYEVIKVAEAWDFDKDAYLFNVLKYIARPGKGNYLEDLRKARFYLNRKIARLEAEQKKLNGESSFKQPLMPCVGCGEFTCLVGTAWCDLCQAKAEHKKNLVKEKQQAPRNYGYGGVGGSTAAGPGGGGGQAYWGGRVE
jgi:hypothetical protein